MRFRFADEKLKAFYQYGKGANKYPDQVYRQFVKVVNLIKAVENENELRQYKSLRLEKLSGNLKGYSSMRLGPQFRLIVTFEDEIAILHRVEDYH